jgi:site-specific DNA-methyltransferase (adenine-specific)
MPPAKSQEWGTPWWLFELLDLEFQFTVDAAASSKNTKMERYWTEEINGLHQDWTRESVFVNPPFLARDLRLWTEKAWVATREPETKCAIIVPVKSDQDWWHDYGIKTEIRFIKGRVAFEGAKSSYPGPIAVLVFGKYVRPRNLTIRIPAKRFR